MYDTLRKDFKKSQLNTTFFIEYFQNYKYYDLMKLIITYFPQIIKNNINKFYHITTNTYSKKSVLLSKLSYNKLCDQVSILKSPMDGDCFFKAVADGINIYNYENQSSNIVYNNYGINNLFTIKVLREIVFRYITQLSNERINDMLLAGQELSNSLNEKFGIAIDGFMRETGVRDITDENYLDIVNNVYHSDTNFLVKKPEEVPKELDLYYSPFRVITKQEFQQYILSKNYWANDIATDAICDMLGICIIPIEKYDYETKIRLAIKSVDRLKALISNNKLIKDACSNKVMFLFYKNNHYELIRFKYFVKPVTKTIGQDIRQQKIIEYKKKWYTIFNNNDLSPPIHILLLIYATTYSTILDIETKNNFSIYLPIMKQLDTTCKKILYTESRVKFIKLFNDLFPNNRPVETRLISMVYNPDTLTSNELFIENPEQEEEEEEEGDVVLPSVRGENQPLQMVTRSKTQMQNPYQDIEGGQNRYSSPYRYPPYYGYPRPGYITKKPEERDSSKIAYSIIIDMELHPGTSLTPQQISESKCNTKYNAIRKAFAEFTGRPYVIPPVYNKTVKNKNPSNVPVETKNNPRFDNTRRKAPPAASLGGKTRKHKY